MRRTFSCVACSLVVLLALAACEHPPTASPSSDNIRLSASQADAPGAPTAIPFSVTFPDDDPCTPVFDPNEHLVTISGTAFVHALDNGNRVTRLERTITTDSGYEGRGESTVINNDNAVQFQLNDINTHPDGRKFRAHGVVLVDLSTGAVRVAMGGLTCIKT